MAVVAAIAVKRKNIVSKMLPKGILLKTIGMVINNSPVLRQAQIRMQTLPGRLQGLPSWIPEYLKGLLLQQCLANFDFYRSNSHMLPWFPCPLTAKER